MSFYILGECSKLNLKALEAFISLSQEQEKNSVNNSTLVVLKSTPRRSKYGLESWPCELGCVYVEILADICINSNNSLIKRRALIGFHKDAVEILNLKWTNRLSMGYGLLETAKFQPLNLKNEEGLY